MKPGPVFMLWKVSQCLLSLFNVKHAKDCQHCVTIVQVFYITEDCGDTVPGVFYRINLLLIIYSILFKLICIISTASRMSS